MIYGIHVINLGVLIILLSLKENYLIRLLKKNYPRIEIVSLLFSQATHRVLDDYIRQAFRPSIHQSRGEIPFKKSRAENQFLQTIRLDSGKNDSERAVISSHTCFRI